MIQVFLHFLNHNNNSVHLELDIELISKTKDYQLCKNPPLAILYCLNRDNNHQMKKVNNLKVNLCQLQYLFLHLKIFRVK